VIELIPSVQLDAFPTVGCSFGPSGCFSSFYLGALRFLVDAPGVLQEGYEKVCCVLHAFRLGNDVPLKYGNKPFKVATMLRWTVVFSDPQRMAEIANAAEEDLSFREAIKDVRPLSSLQLETIDTTVEIMGVDDTLGINVGSSDNDLLSGLLRSHITRNTVKICGEVQDELLKSLESILGKGTDGEDHTLKMKWCLIPVRVDRYPRFRHRKSNNGTDMAAVLRRLSPMYMPQPFLSKILTMSSRS